MWKLIKAEFMVNLPERYSSGIIVLFLAIPLLSGIFLKFYPEHLINYKLQPQLEFLNYGIVMLYSLLMFKLFEKIIKEKRIKLIRMLPLSTDDLFGVIFLIRVIAFTYIVISLFIYIYIAIGVNYLLPSYEFKQFILLIIILFAATFAGGLISDLLKSEIPTLLLLANVVVLNPFSSIHYRYLNEASRLNADNSYPLFYDFKLPMFYFLAGLLSICFQWLYYHRRGTFTR